MLFSDVLLEFLVLFYFLLFLPSLLFLQLLDILDQLFVEYLFPLLLHFLDLLLQLNLILSFQ